MRHHVHLFRIVESEARQSDDLSPLPLELPEGRLTVAEAEKGVPLAGGMRMCGRGKGDVGELQAQKFCQMVAGHPVGHLVSDAGHRIGAGGEVVATAGRCQWFWRTFQHVAVGGVVPAIVGKGQPRDSGKPQYAYSSFGFIDEFFYGHGV